MTVTPTTGNTAPSDQSITQEIVQTLAQATDQESPQETPQTTTQETVQGTPQTTTQETVQEIPQSDCPDLDMLSERIAATLVPEVVKNNLLSLVSKKSVSEDDSEQDSDLKRAVYLAVSSRLSEYFISETISLTSLTILLQSVTVGSAVKLSRTCISRIETLVLKAVDLFSELLSYKIVLTDENIREYVSPAGFDGPIVEILIELYTGCLDSHGLKDFPLLQDYLVIIKEGVLKVTKGMELESPDDLKNFIPSPLSSRHSQNTVPPRILEMIGQRLWSDWEALNPCRPLTAREALDLIYSLHRRFAGEKLDDEEAFVRKTFRTLDIDRELVDEILLRRKITAECIKAYTKEYIQENRLKTLAVPKYSGQFPTPRIMSLGGFDITFCNFSTAGRCFHVTQDSKIVLAVQSSKNYEIIFEEHVDKISYEFFCEFSCCLSDDSVKASSKLVRYLQRSNEEQCVALLDILLKDSKGVFTEPSILVNRFQSEKLSEEYMSMLERLAPVTYQKAIKICENADLKASLCLVHNDETYFRSPSIVEKLCSPENLKTIGELFLANPNRETLEYVMYSRGENEETPFFNLFFYHNVAALIIRRGLVDLSYRAYDLIKDYCWTFPADALYDLRKYARSKLLTDELDTDFISQCLAYILGREIDEDPVKLLETARVRR